MHDIFFPCVMYTMYKRNFCSSLLRKLKYNFQKRINFNNKLKKKTNNQDNLNVEE